MQLNYEFVRDKFRHKNIYRGLDGHLKALFRQREVLHGPFRGLKYAVTDAVCSSVIPKLLGSYEKEIQSELQNLIARKPRLVIDIGCAEGYYAVGIARALPEAQVVAADTSSRARELCMQLAAYNGCTNVRVTGTVTAGQLATYDLADALVICDCEGYEKHLFTAENIAAFKHACLIIETHDLVDLSISRYLEDLFRPSHDIKVIASVDDVQKSKYYDYPELKPLSPAERKVVLAESRPTIMEWLVLTPRLYAAPDLKG